jgi:predicted PurR-regulated permease PerM
MLFILLSAMFNFLIHGRTILSMVGRYTPLTDDDQARMLGVYTSVGRATVKGTVVIGIVQGGLAGLSFWVAGIEGPLFWGAVMTVLSIIPGIGTALVWVPAVAFLALTERVGAAVGVGLWCALVVGTVDNVLRPVLVGKDTELPELLVMLTTFGGLALFGAAGIIIGPIIGSLFMTIWKLWSGAIDEAGSGSDPAAKTSPG